MSSAMICAAISAADTFHRDAERRIGPRYLAGTNDGSPPDPASSPSPPRPIEFAAAEHGAGPRVYPKCHGSQEKSSSYRLALPPLKVPVPT